MDSDSDSDIDHSSGIMQGVFNASNMSDASGKNLRGQGPLMINQNVSGLPGNVPQVPLKNGKKTRGRVKIKMEFIEDKLRRYTTFSKRKTGLMKKAYELSTLTGTEVLLLVASETGHVYTFATRKLQPMITSDSGKALIQTCLNSPDVSQDVDGDDADSHNEIDNFDDSEFPYSSSPPSQIIGGAGNVGLPIYVDTSSRGGDSGSVVRGTSSIMVKREGGSEMGDPTGVSALSPMSSGGQQPMYSNQTAPVSNDGDSITIRLTPPASSSPSVGPPSQTASSPAGSTSHGNIPPNLLTLPQQPPSQLPTSPLQPPGRGEGPPSAVSLSDIITPSSQMDKLTGLSFTPLLLTPTPWLSGGTPFQLSSTLPQTTDNSTAAGLQQTTAFRFPDAATTTNAGGQLQVLNLSSGVAGGTIMTSSNLMSLNTPTVTCIGGTNLTSQQSQVQLPGSNLMYHGPQGDSSVYSVNSNAAASPPDGTVTTGDADGFSQYISIPVTYLPVTPGNIITTSVKCAASSVVPQPAAHETVSLLDSTCKLPTSTAATSQAKKRMRKN